VTRTSGFRILRPIQRWRHEARLRRAVRCSEYLLRRVPREVPLNRDLTWGELRRIVPAILAPEGSTVFGGLLLPAFEAVCRSRLDAAVVSPSAPIKRIAIRSNFIALTGLYVACNTALLPGALPAVAWAVLLSDSWWRVPRRAVRRMLQACVESEWDSVTPALAVRALRDALRRRPVFALWRRLLAALAASGDWPSVLSEAAARRHFFAAARKGISQNGGSALLRPRLERVAHGELVLAAELIGRAYCQLERFDRHSARYWLLPLIERATGRYIDRTTAARFLCDNLRTDGPIRAEEVAKAIERGIAPLSQDDYSNFRRIFSINSWMSMREAFRHWAIVAELDRFAAAEDRIRFWRYFESAGAER